MYLLIEGMPGTGKTTVAKKMASVLGVSYMKSVVSDTKYGEALRDVLKSGVKRSMELLYLSDLALDESRVWNFRKAGGLVRDKSYASSLAHVRAHGFENTSAPVRKAIEAFFRELAGISLKPDLVIFLRASGEVVRERMCRKSDASDWDLYLAQHLDSYELQKRMLESELMSRYADRIMVVDTDGLTVEEVCIMIGKKLREVQSEES